MGRKHLAKKSESELTERTIQEVDSLPLSLPIWVTKGPSSEPCATSSSDIMGSTPSIPKKKGRSWLAFLKRATNQR